MTSGEGEPVQFPSLLQCDGPVEDWLTELMEHVASSLRTQLFEALQAYIEVPRERFLTDASAQHAITTSQVWWTSDVNAAFERLEQGNETAVKEYVATVMGGLEGLSRMVLGELTKQLRIKIKTIITIEVHARDVVQRLIDMKVDSAGSFAWQSQLKYRWDEEQKDCFINICDAEFRYSYEYVGNCGRLVITALTDRCYITLTQALRLILGGAPAGPAGTGKTETTKDLGRGLVSAWSSDPRHPRANPLCSTPPPTHTHTC
jgi:dynein heavy chain